MTASRSQANRSKPDGSLPETERALPSRLPRPRTSRAFSLGLLSLLIIATVLAARVAIASPADTAAVRSVEGTASKTEVVETTRPRPPAQVPQALRQVVEQTTTTAAPTTTTTAPTTTTAAPTTTVPPTTAPPTTATPTTTTAPPAPPTTAPAANRQSGQATWYRWKAGNCAHNTLPKGTRVTVTNVATGASAVCTVGDRGAFGYPTIIDLDATVFEQIAPLGAGRIDVTITW